MNNIETYKVNYKSPDFNNKFGDLVSKKKFRRLPAQIQELITEVEKGNFDGTVYATSKEPPYDVYKLRLPNPDANAGKSNGYRVFYLARHDKRTIAFLLIYYKKEQETVAESYIRALIDGYFLSTLPESDEEAE